MTSTYSFASPRKPALPLAVFEVLYMGVAVAEHGSLEAAWERAWRLSDDCNTSILNFSVRKVQL